MFRLIPLHASAAHFNPNRISRSAGNIASVCKDNNAAVYCGKRISVDNTKKATTSVFLRAWHSFESLLSKRVRSPSVAESSPHRSTAASDSLFQRARQLQKNAQVQQIQLLQQYIDRGKCENIREIRTPDGTMVPDNTVASRREFNPYHEIGNDGLTDNVRETSRSGALPRTRLKQNIYHEIGSGSGVRALPVIRTNDTAMLKALAAARATPCNSDLSAAGSVPGMHAWHGLARTKFAIAVEGARQKMIEGMSELLAKLFGKSGLPLFASRNACEEMYQGVYARHFNIAYQQQVGGLKPHLDVLRSAHVYADNHAQGSLLVAPDDARIYGKCLLQMALKFDAAGMPTIFSPRS